MRFSYVPCSKIVPFPMTIICCAFRIVLNRWAIVKTVRPCETLSNDFCINDSDILSSALVASSNIKIDGFWKCKFKSKFKLHIKINYLFCFLTRIKARAIATRCFCPPLNIIPR